MAYSETNKFFHKHFIITQTSIDIKAQWKVVKDGFDGALTTHPMLRAVEIH